MINNKITSLVIQEGLKQELILGYSYEIAKNIFLDVKVSDSATHNNELFVVTICGVSGITKQLVTVLPQIPFMFIDDAGKRYFMITKETFWHLVELNAQ